jgi:hypothetical protein
MGISTWNLRLFQRTHFSLAVGQQTNSRFMKEALTAITFSGAALPAFLFRAEIGYTHCIQLKTKKAMHSYRNQLYEI